MLEKLIGPKKHPPTRSEHERIATEYEDEFGRIIRKQEAIIDMANQSRKEIDGIRDRIERDPFPYLIRGR